MPFHYNVRPRYTAGSPAQVDQRTAFEQADNERRHYEIALEGVYGEKEQERAKQLGLGPVREQILCPNCGFDQDKQYPTHCLSCGWPLHHLVNDGKHYSPAELVIEHSNHWFVRCLITGEMFVRPFAWVDPIKTTNCKKCRDEHEKAEFNKLRAESRPWRSQAARQSKID